MLIGVESQSKWVEKLRKSPLLDVVSLVVGGIVRSWFRGSF
jgi:hypothetical protein